MDMRTEYMNLEVSVDKQGVAYTPGNGEVLWLSDSTTATAFDSLTPIQRDVAAARFRALAKMAEGDE